MKKYCINCGKEIPEGRIKALPKTTTCVECSHVKVKKVYQNVNSDGEDVWIDLDIVDDKD